VFEFGSQQRKREAEEETIRPKDWRLHGRKTKSYSAYSICRIKLSTASFSSLEHRSCCVWNAMSHRNTPKPRVSFVVASPCHSNIQPCPSNPPPNTTLELPDITCISSSQFVHIAPLYTSDIRRPLVCLNRTRDIPSVLPRSQLSGPNRELST
jgi:hypothetical protein